MEVDTRFEIQCWKILPLILLVVIIKLLAWITSSYLIAIIIVSFGFYKLLRAVGMFALYPACFCYIKGDNELRFSSQWNRRIAKFAQELLELLNKWERGEIPRSGLQTKDFISGTIRTLSRFEDTLSDRKKEILSIFREIDQIFNTNYPTIDSQILINDFLENPMILQTLIPLSEDSHQKVLSRKLKLEISPLFCRLHSVLETFYPPVESNFLKKLIHRMYSEKLYEIRFAYSEWEHRYAFDIYTVKTKCEKEMLECAVIRGFAHYESMNSNGETFNAKKSIMFCCPNGAYLQYFALDSEYVDMYLKLGFSVVLWNYRGYGQSTGDPSIATCIEDSQQIYDFCRNTLNLNIEIVHGYSIGGPPAVTLAVNNNIKILVADRTFCNFVNIAEEISPLLAKLARLVMKEDAEIRISESYLKIKNCKKILIWSPVDEVISHGSSLKLGILNRLFEKINFYLNSHKNGSDEELYETDSFITDESQSTNLTQENITRKKEEKEDGAYSKIEKWISELILFFEKMRMYESKVRENRAETNSNDKESVSFENNENLIQNSEKEMSEHVNSSTFSSVKKTQQLQILNEFWNRIHYINGGGVYTSMFRDKGEERNGILNIEVRSFVLGLIFYGVCEVSSTQIQGKYQNRKDFTLDILNSMEKEIEQFVNKFEKSISQPLKAEFLNFNNLLKEIREFLQKRTFDTDREIGSIIVTNSGHNGELKNSEISLLINLIEKDYSIDKMIHE